MEEYLTVIELSSRIKFSKQSLYNLIHKGTLIRGKHYLKPTPKKVLFKWLAIRDWMGDSFSIDNIPTSKHNGHHASKTANNLIGKHESFIKI